MRASRRLPRLLFQPGIAAMYARTGASPSAFAICGLPPERRAGFFMAWPKRDRTTQRAPKKHLAAWLVEDVSVFCFEGGDSRASPLPLCRECVQLTPAFYAALLAKLLVSRRRICPYSRTTQAASCLSTRAARMNVIVCGGCVNEFLRVTQKIHEIFFLQIAPA